MSHQCINCAQPAERHVPAVHSDGSVVQVCPTSTFEEVDDRLLDVDEPDVPPTPTGE